MSLGGQDPFVRGNTPISPVGVDTTVDKWVEILVIWEAGNGWMVGMLELIVCKYVDGQVAASPPESVDPEV